MATISRMASHSGKVPRKTISANKPLIILVAQRRTPDRFELNARVIVHADPITEIDGDGLPQPHSATHVVTDLHQSISPRRQMAARFTATERQTGQKEVQGRPHFDPHWRISKYLHIIDAEPQSWPR